MDVTKKIKEAIEAPTRGRKNSLWITNHALVTLLHDIEWTIYHCMLGKTVTEP